MTEETVAIAENAAEARRQMLSQVFDELKNAHKTGETIEVEVTSLVKGGFKTLYKELPIFLPTKSYSSKRNISDDELNAVVGTTLKVKVIDFTEDEFAKVAKISHKHVIEEEMWKGISEGSTVEGKVKSILEHGLIVDINGIDAFAHISQLSRQRINDIHSFAKVGDVLKANVLTIEKERSRLTLTLKNLANPNWEDFFETTKVGDKVKGKIKSIKRFGAFVEIAPNVVGFLKSNEISWTMRDVDINNLFSVGQEIETEIYEIDKAKEQINLSYRRLQPNNWKEIADKYEKNLEYSAVVKFIPPNDSGAVVSLNNEIDGFMPAQKMKALYTGKKPNFKAGDVVQVKIMEKDYEKYSLLFESAIKPENPFVSAEGNDFSNNRNKNAVATAETKGTNNYTFADLLSESSKKNLLK